MYQHIDTKMASKNIAVRDEVYQKLLQGKRGEESFSDVIARLIEGRSELMSFAGILSKDEEFERAVDDIATVRKRAVLRH